MKLFNPDFALDVDEEYWDFGDKTITNGRLVIGSLIQYSNRPCGVLANSTIPIGCKWFRDFYVYTWDSNCNETVQIVTEEYSPDANNTRILREARIEEAVPCKNCQRTVVKRPVPGTLRNNCGIPYVK